MAIAEENHPQTEQTELQALLRELAGNDFYTRAMLFLAIGSAAVLLAAVLILRYLPAVTNFRLGSQIVCVGFTGLMVGTLWCGVYLLQQRRQQLFLREILLQKVLREPQGTSQMIDASTGTFSREYFEKALERELMRAERHSSNFTLLQCSIADFSGLRRRHGNVAGDHLVMVLARTLQSSLRGSDVVCHTGAAEFTVILPETSEHTAQPPVERILGSVERWNKSSTLEYRLQVQIGLSQYTDGSSSEEMMEEVLRRRRINQFMPTTIFTPPEPLQNPSGTEHRVQERSNHVARSQ